MNFQNTLQRTAFQYPLVSAEQAADERYFKPVLAGQTFTLWAGLTINR